MEPRPDTDSVNPFVRSDPFWGEPPFTWAYITIGCMAAGFLLATALIIWGLVA